MKLVPSNDPALKTVCNSVLDSELPALRLQTDIIRELMRRKKGCGLAAPQFGDTRRYFCWADGLVINPELLKGTKLELSEEGCHSYPGVHKKIWRYSEINVRYQLADGTTKTETLTELKARIFQHELDHLNGLCKISPDYKGS